MGRLVNTQKQARMAFDPRALFGVTAAPVGVQSADLALSHRRFAAEAEVLHDARAGFSFVARQRHQVFHRSLRRDGTVAHRGLSVFGQQVHQGQAPADPAARATQPLAQLLLAQCVSDDELIEKPTIFERTATAYFIESMRHDECVGFRQRQQYGVDHVVRERARGAHAQIAVDQHEAVPLIIDGCDHADRTLLTVGGQARAHTRRSPSVANA